MPSLCLDPLDLFFLSDRTSAGPQKPAISSSVMFEDQTLFRKIASQVFPTGVSTRDKSTKRKGAARLSLSLCANRIPRSSLSHSPLSPPLPFLFLPVPPLPLPQSITPLERVKTLAPSTRSYPRPLLSFFPSFLPSFDNTVDKLKPKKTPVQSPLFVLYACYLYMHGSCGLSLVKLLAPDGIQRVKIVLQVKVI